MTIGQHVSLTSGGHANRTGPSFRFLLVSSEGSGEIGTDLIVGWVESI